VNFCEFLGGEVDLVTMYNWLTLWGWSASESRNYCSQTPIAPVHFMSIH